jgi:hypothetical protein
VAMALLLLLLSSSSSSSSSVLRFELRAYTLSHSTSPFFVKGILRWGLVNYLPGLALNRDPPDLCLLSS